MRRSEAAFTLIELLVVLTIMSVLATVIFPLAEHSVRRQKEAQLKQALFDIRHSLDAYHASVSSNVLNFDYSSGYPADLQQLVETKNEFGDAFLRAIPRDPFVPSVGSIESGWGLRSSQSTADSPAAGSDVYDVYSLSKEIGSNGVPYREW